MVQEVREVFSEAAGTTIFVGDSVRFVNETELMGTIYGARAAAQLFLRETSFVAGVARPDGRFITPNVHDGPEVAALAGSFLSRQKKFFEFSGFLVFGFSFFSK